MSDKLLLRNALLVDLDPPRVEAGDLRIREGLIVERAPSLEPLGEAEVDLGGDVLLPGLVNAHTHLYSSLATGMPAPPVVGFEDALEKIWWPLDRSLTLEDVGVSAEVGLVRALKAGTTTVIDHHASPAAIEGSLDLIREAVARVGLRGVLSYEVTDRNGAEGARAGLAENRRAIAEIQDSQCRAIVGLHASFTLSEESLQAAAAMGAPVHVHVAEGEGDGEDATKRGFAGVVDRLERSGVLRTGSILAHVVHLGDEEVARVLESGCWLVHNPSSNRNNRVGYAHPGRFAEGLALGTDGIGSDMWGAVTEAFLAAREHHHEIDCLSALTGGHRLASQLLGISLGRLEAGFAADLVRLRGPLSTPLTADNLGGHLLFDWDAQRVRDVWVAGEPVLCEGVVLRVDTAALGKRSRVAAEALWGRYRGEIGR